MDLNPLVLIVSVLIGLVIQYGVIRSAVKHALRDARYEKFMEQNYPEDAKWAQYGSERKSTPKAEG